MTLWLWTLLGCGGPTSPLAADVVAHLEAGADAPRPAIGRPLPDEVRTLLAARIRERPDAATLGLYIDLVSREAPEALYGANVIRDPRDVRLLVERAPDEPVARRALLFRVPRAVLQERGAPLASLAGEDPPTVRLLAKAGVGYPMPHEGLPDDLHRAWQAATGDPVAEQALIDALSSATDGPTTAAAIDALGWAATDRALKAVAGELRTPLRRPHGSGERSVRLDVLEALAVHFPAEIVFATQEITAAKDYRRAEKRVAALLGVEVTGPTPPFFTQGPRVTD